MFVYKITNTINNKCYIGSTNNFERRKQEHIYAAMWEKSQSYNYPLQRAIRKYGLDNFTFEIIESDIPAELIASKEAQYIQDYNCLAYNGWGYNQSADTLCCNRDPVLIQKFIEDHGKKCALVDTNNNILQLFNSLHEAARQTNLVGRESSIRDICEGNETAINDLIFRYIINNEVVIPEQRRRKRKKKICGISIFDANDIIIYDSVSDAARIEHIERGSLSKCISGNTRFSYVHNRIWREYNNGVIENDIPVMDIILKNSGYCVINYNTNEIISANSITELSNKTGLNQARLQRNLKLNKKIKNYGYYKLDIFGKPIIKEGD